MIHICLLIFAISAVIKTEHSDGAKHPEFKCIHTINGFCNFHKINLTKSEPHFQPTSDRLPVTKVNMGGWDNSGSHMNIFTNSTCNTFPALRVIHAYSLGLESIQENAFSNCLQLQELSLSKNKFNEYPFEEIGVLDNLKVLWINSNEIRELSPTKLLQYYPNLKRIHLNDNDINCKQLKQIIRKLKEHKIDFTTAENVRRRTYDLALVDGNTCVPNELWDKLEYGNAGQTILCYLGLNMLGILIVLWYFY